MESLLQYSLTSNRHIVLMRWLIVISCLIYTIDSFSQVGDELIVNESLVNIRVEPNTDAEVLLKLQRDRKVTEIQRDGNWVEVEIHREDKGAGWIHKSLLSKATVSKNTSSPTRFDNFMQRFNNHIEVITKQSGTLYFSEVEHKGQGQLKIIATQAWLSSDIETRNNSLSEIFRLWSDVSPVGSSISIEVLDEQGEKYTVMLR